MSSNAPKNEPPVEPPIQIVRPNVLRERIGGKLPANLAQLGAQAVTNQLNNEFDNWMNEIALQLERAHRELQAEDTPQTRDDLYKVALELKSQGETCDYQLATRVAHNLCRLILNMRDLPLPLGLVQAHVQTLHVIVRDQVKGATNPVGLALADELEVQARAFYAGQA